MDKVWAILWSFTLAWALCGCPLLRWPRRWDRSGDWPTPELEYSGPPEELGPPDWPAYDDGQLEAAGTAAFYGGPMDGEYIALETYAEILRLRRVNDRDGIPVTIAYQLFDCDPDQPEYVYIGEMAE